jgi:DNA-binding NarL/FixJ family response regulator
VSHALSDHRSRRGLTTAYPALNLVAPLDEGGASSGARTAPAAVPAMSVLLVGDTRAVRSPVERLLRGFDLTVTSAGDLGVSARLPNGSVRDIGLVVLPMTADLPATIRRLLDEGVVRRVVVLSAPDLIDGPDLLAALMAGADGWLGSDLAPDVLLRSLNGILRGEPGLSRRHVAELVSFLRAPSRPAPAQGNPRVAGLTSREHEIFLALTTESSVRSIAATLSLSEGTVRWYTARLLRKLNVASRSDLAALLVPGVEPDAPAHQATVVALPTVVPLPTRRPTDHRPARKPAAVPATAVPPAWSTLPKSELRVVELVVKGLTNRQIAEALFLSKHTVDSHLKSAFVKLGVRSRVELTVLVHRQPD